MTGTPAAALVGTGFIGPVHLEALRRLGRPVAGVLGSSPERGRAAAGALGVPRAYDSLAELLADPAVGSVHLTSPNRLHFEQCREVLTAGKHLVCEKPLAMNSRETAELAQMAAKTPVSAAVNYNCRFYPLCHEARERIASGELGTIHHVSGAYVQDWLLRDTDFNWRVLASEGGPLRAVADIGTHWLDLVTWMLGQPVSEVQADLATFLPVRQAPPGGRETFAAVGPGGSRPVAIDTEDYGSVLLRFSGGARGALTVSQVTAGRKNCLRFEVAGSKGALAWDSQRPDELWLGRRDAASQLLLRDPALLGPAARALCDYPGGHAEGFPDTFKQLFRTFYRHADANAPTAEAGYPTFADGHQEALTCEAILRSHQARCWVSV